jgi:uncharacterized protein (TIGR02722 family)
MKTVRIILLFLGIAAMFFTGCTATTKSYSPKDLEQGDLHYDEAYDATDKKEIVNTLVNKFMAGTVCCKEGRPVIIIYGISNQTDEHINTSGITDDIRQEILRTGSFRFVSEAQRDNIERELAYQYGGAVSPETRVERARQVGAQYMLTGSLRSIEKKEPRQIRLKKKTLMYYSLNLELTDLKTSLIEWADSVEIVRESAKPFIGW